MKALTKPEIKAAIEVGGELATEGSLPDPWSWSDLVAHSDNAADKVLQRLDFDRTPLLAQTVTWPKDTGGNRPMIWMDPFDQALYRGLVGRLVNPIGSNVDKARVFSCRLEQKPPRWKLSPWKPVIAERRVRGLELLDGHAGLGMIDIKDFYPTIELESIARMLTAMGVPGRLYGYLISWLQDLNDSQDVRGIPTGHDPSRVLADGLLVECDRVLSDLGLEYIRYVDDTWFFLDHPELFDQVIERYKESLKPLGLEVHPVKTRLFEGSDAEEIIQNSVLSYLDDVLRSPGPEGLDAALGLFEFAAQDPTTRRTELRRALGVLGERHHLGPLEALQNDVELMRYAPDPFARYLKTLLAHGKARKSVEPDWLVEQALRGAEQQATGYRTIVLLRGMADFALSKNLGQEIHALTTLNHGWQTPIRVWAARVWGGSQAFKPQSAVDDIEVHGDYSTRRAFALTLNSCRDHKKMQRWGKNASRLEHELEPTFRYLMNYGVDGLLMTAKNVNRALLVQCRPAMLHPCRLLPGGARRTRERRGDV